MRHRSALVAAVAVTMLVLTACSGSGDTDQGTSGPAPTEQTEEQAVEDLVDRYWSAVVRAENTADASPGQFVNVLAEAANEFTLNKIADQAAVGIVRAGKPEVTEVEITVDGDVAEVAACLNEDGWTAERNGEPVEATQFGRQTWGAVATRTDGRWYITEIRRPENGTKSC